MKNYKDKKYGRQKLAKERQKKGEGKAMKLESCIMVAIEKKKSTSYEYIGGCTRLY